MKIKGFSEFKESISGWELIGQHSMGPNYPEQKLPVSLSTEDTTILSSKDGTLYTMDDYHSLYIDYLKGGGQKLEGDFTQRNLDIVLDFLKK